MFKNVILVLFFAASFAVYGQKDSITVNPKYLEDQIYFGLTYNIFANTPEGFLKDGFAYGFSAGFIKDFPFNKGRNVGLGIGLGYSFNTYIQNVVVSENYVVDGFNATLFPDTYTIKTNSIELPIEFRWRTSTLEKYKFWRIYTGVNLSYVLNSNSIGENSADLVVSTENLVLEKFQYALTMAAGYGSWNFYVNYSLSPFFKSNTDTDTGAHLDMNTFRLGLMFYLL